MKLFLNFFIRKGRVTNIPIDRAGFNKIFFKPFDFL